MINQKFFFDNVRNQLFDGKLRQGQVEGLSAILNEWEENYSKEDDRWLAYMLATAHHETDRSIEPIEEYGKGKGRKYGNRRKLNGGSYHDTENLFYGRGFVQLTWYENYEKAGKKLKIDLLKKPELALEPKYATKIMFLGMTEGWFTAKKLSTYFNTKNDDWEKARRIINGMDKANLIASYAKKYYSSISYTV